MTEVEYSALMQKITAHIQKYNTQIVSDMNKVNTALIEAAYGTDSYWEIKDQAIKNDITTFLSSINSAVWKVLKNNTDIKMIEFVNSIITSMSNNTNGFSDAWNGLFSPELDELSIEDCSQKINSFLDTICSTLYIDSENGKRLFKISLGLDVYDDTSKRLKNSIRTITDDQAYNKFLIHTNFLLPDCSIKYENVTICYPLKIHPLYMV